MPDSSCGRRAGGDAGVAAGSPTAAGPGGRGIDAIMRSRASGPPCAARWRTGESPRPLPRCPPACTSSARRRSISATGRPPCPSSAAASSLAYLALKRAWVGRAELAAHAVARAGARSSPSPTCARRCSACSRCPGRRPIEVEGGALRLDMPTDVGALRGGAARGPRRRCARALRAATCSPASTTTRARPGPAGSASSASGCAPRGAAPCWRSWSPARSMPREAIELSGAPARGRSARRGGAARAHACARARAARRRGARRPIATSSAGFATTSASPPAAELQALHDSLVGRAAAAAAAPAARRRRGRRRRLRRPLAGAAPHRRAARRRTTAACSASSARAASARRASRAARWPSWRRDFARRRRVRRPRGRGDARPSSAAGWRASSASSSPAGATRSSR